MESHCLSAAKEEKIERSEMIDNRAQLHGLMRNAMERVSVPIKKGEGCATLFTFDDDR
ncbi:hypothetical protein [Prevotella pectinovora]|uniref:hypothetical protein n=1 Tax=Prevotella pectinovora TaxID=1602169 RepID=UPI002FDA20F7